MSTVPQKAADKVSFYERHIDPWTAHSAGIGLLPADVTDLDTKTDAARAAIDAQESAQDAARAATLAAHNAVAAMAQAGSDCIKKIRAKAGSAGTNVYVLAEIPEPAIPSPAPAPATPANLVVTLDGSGALTLKWKCANPAGTSGTMYQLWRRNSPTGEFAYIGATGKKSFTDNTLPVGSSEVAYKIQAVRSTAVSNWAQFTVNFGTSGGGAMTASVVETVTGPAKMAA